MLVSLPVSGADAIETPPTIQEEPAAEVPSEPIVIESDAPSPAPGEEELAQKFREALGSVPDSTIAEHQLANGPLVVTTPFGRLCAEPPPRHLESGLGGEITLLAPCTVF